MNECGDEPVINNDAKCANLSFRDDFCTVIVTIPFENQILSTFCRKINYGSEKFVANLDKTTGTGIRGSKNPLVLRVK